MDGKTARGASSPANPALTKPEPLSHTRAVVSSSSHISGSHLPVPGAERHKISEPPPPRFPDGPPPPPPLPAERECDLAALVVRVGPVAGLPLPASAAGRGVGATASQRPLCPGRRGPRAPACFSRGSTAVCKAARRLEPSRWPRPSVLPRPMDTTWGQQQTEAGRLARPRRRSAAGQGVSSIVLAWQFVLLNKERTGGESGPAESAAVFGLAERRSGSPPPLEHPSKERGGGRAGGGKGAPPTKLGQPCKVRLCCTTGFSLPAGCCVCLS